MRSLKGESEPEDIWYILWLSEHNFQVEGGWKMGYWGEKKNKPTSETWSIMSC